MNRRIVILLVISATIAISTSGLARADVYNGWGEIRQALIDGDGAEFVVPITGFSSNKFTGATEMDAAIAAANWVAYHMLWVADPNPPGDVWTSSDQQYADITEGVEDSGTGDCEDFAILLCALLRFHTQGGIPADRVWVQAGIITDPIWDPNRPPVYGHAFVVYKSENHGVFYIEPQIGVAAFRGNMVTLLLWHTTLPPPFHVSFAGECAMLRFNDQWVRGGGFWLAGPRAEIKKTQ